MTEVYKVTVMGDDGVPESLFGTPAHLRMKYPPGKEVSGTAILCFVDEKSARSFRAALTRRGAYAIWRCEAEGVFIPGHLLTISGLSRGDIDVEKFWFYVEHSIYPTQWPHWYVYYSTWAPRGTRACSKITLKERVV